MPVVLQCDIDEQARAERQARDQHDEGPPARSPAEPSRSPTEVKQAERHQHDEGHDDEDLAGRISQGGRGEESAVSPIHSRRDPEVQLRPHREQQSRQECQAES